MMKEFFEYNGEKYPCKAVFFQNENVSYIIAQESLERILWNENGTYVSDETKSIDEQIFFFVPDEILNQSEELIAKYVSEAL